jgi:hypothetical protein
MRREEQGALLDLGRGPERVHRASVSTFVLVSRKGPPRLRVDGKRVERIKIRPCIDYFRLKGFSIIVQKRRIGERWGREGS